MSENDYEDGNNSYGGLTTAHGLAKQIKKDIDKIGLEEEYTAVTVDLELESGNTDIDYVLEATDVYKELDYTPETTHFESSGRIEPANDTFPADEGVVTEALEENLDSALKVNGKVVRELLSPDYNAF